MGLKIVESKLNNSIDSWDKVADCLKNHGAVKFDYIFSEEDIIEIFICKGWCDLPSEIKVETFIVSVWGGGHEEFDIMGTDYDADCTELNNMLLDDIEKITIVQLLRALKSRL